MFQNIQDVQEEKVDNKKGTNKGKYIYISIILGLVIGIGVLYSNSKNKLEQLSSKINEKEEKINQTNDKLNKINSELEEMKNKEESIVETQTEIIVADEEGLSEKAQKLKSQGDTSEAIKYYKLVVENGKTKKYISEAIYQVAYLNEKLKNYDEAIKYYKKYVYTYNSSENYFDDCYYNMGMIYYNNGDLENAKKMFYSLRAEDPDSIYNNSKVKEILKEK